MKPTTQKNLLSLALVLTLFAPMGFAQDNGEDESAYPPPPPEEADPALPPPPGDNFEPPPPPEPELAPEAEPAPPPPLPAAEVTPLEPEQSTAPAEAEKPERPAPRLSIVCTPIEGLDPSEKVGPIVMANMKILQALDLLRTYSGRAILPGDNLPDAKINFNSGGQMRRDEIIYAVENLLALNGVALRELEGGFIRAIGASDPGRDSAPLIEELPEGDGSQQFYTKIFTLDYFDSNTAFQRVRDLLSGDDRSDIDRLNESNALMVTDTLVNLKRIAEVLDHLDKPRDSRFQLYTFPVRHGSAWSLRRTLLQVFRTEMNNRLKGSLVYVDHRTNKLIVVTHPTNRKFFEETIDELDEEVAPFTTTKVIQIEEGNYWSIWGIIRGIVWTQQRQFRQQSFRSAQETEEADGVRQISTGGESAETPVENAGGEQAVPAASIATAQSDPNAVMVAQEMPELQFSPYIALYADPSNKAFIVYGTRSDISRMENLVAQLDIKSAPYVSSEVIDIEHARANDIRTIINYTVQTQRRAFQREGMQSGQERAGAEGPPTAEGEQGFEFSPFVAIISDQRNNSILVHGTRQDIAQVRQLVSKLDVESAPLTSNEVIYLQHAEAPSLARIIQNIINTQRWLFDRQRMRSQTSGQSATPGLESPPEIGFEFSDYAIVNADRRTNALFVYGTREDIERVRAIVKESDIPVEPVTQTEVFPLTHTDANQTAGILDRIIRGQRNALQEVRSESRLVANPAQGEVARPGGNIELVEGKEALQFSPFITVTPDQRSNSLIVYGTDNDIRQVGDLLEEIDIEVAPLTQSEVFMLENTQASSLHRVLQSVVQGQERALQRVRSRIREIRNVRGEEGVPSETMVQALQFSPYVTITPNARNNSMIVYGTRTDIEQLRQLVELSDIKIAPRTQSRTYFIRHADANDVAETISDLIQQQQRVREREATLTRVFRRGSNEEDDDAAGAPAPEFDVEATEFGSGLEYDEDLQFSPYVSLVADDRSNSVLAYGTDFDLEQISGLIEQIDQVLPQVRIEVVIAEVLLTDDQVSGLDEFGISFRNPFPFQSNVTTDNDLGANTSGPTLQGQDSPSFDMGMTLNNFSLNTIFRVAQEKSNVKVLSAPTITTTHNRTATINVGEARPIITSSASNLNNPDLVTRSTVEYRDIGITLRARPLVGEDSFIQMELEQIVETVIDTQKIDNNIQPIIGTRRAASFVSVRDQEVIVMGGLQAVESTNRDGKVWLLGDLPLIGGLFSPENDSQTVRELIIFIKPYVVESTQREDAVSEEGLDRSAVGREIQHYFQQGYFREQRRLDPPDTDLVEEQTEDAAEESSTEQRRGPRR